MIYYSDICFIKNIDIRILYNNLMKKKHQAYQTFMYLSHYKHGFTNKKIVYAVLFRYAHKS